ncbi:Mu homology domain-containing protein [Pholiota molesta]|nr:Mu homology domain-containing protein [Pholiota molesta]
MGIDGLILLDNTGRPGDVDPVVYVSAYNIGDTSSACCHIQCADMRILCPISGNVDPLFGFAFLQAFVEILQEYFGTLSAATLKDNFDVVYQLLEETLDSGGHPLTTSPNALRDIVLPPSLLNKLLSVAGANINTTINSGSGLGSGPFSSPIPWRKAGLKYTSNEIYFDMIEELKAIVNRSGVPLSTTVLGKIETNSRLSGTRIPDCLLSFTNSNVLVDCAFHPCVRLNRWSRGRTFSFVPPDGKFILADYRYSPSVTKDNIPIPFVIKSNFDLLDYGGEITIVHFNYSGLGRGGVNALDSGIGGSSGASWAFDSRKRVLKWEISSAPPSSSWNLQGSFSTQSIAPRPSHALQVQFEIQSYTFSSLKVEQLKITGETYKPYKGVRGRAIGNVEWRW